MNNQFYKVADFILTHLPNTRKWGRGVFIEWLKWHAMQLQVIFIEEKGKILSVMVGRPIKHLGRAKMAYTVDDGGSIFHVEQLACLNKSASNGLLASMKVRFPKVTKISFTRKKNGGALKVYDLEKFMRIASYGRTQNG